MLGVGVLGVGVLGVGVTEDPPLVNHGVRRAAAATVSSMCRWSLCGCGPVYARSFAPRGRLALQLLRSHTMYCTPMDCAFSINQLAMASP